MDNDNNRKNGKAGRGRPRTQFMKQIIEDIGNTNYKKLKVEVMDRDEWRRSINVIELI